MVRDKSVFHFKKFSVRHAYSTMKVGTDGVLIGAWSARNLQPHHILDVGTGSGLIALILAQRFPDANILGIDIHAPSIEDALYNKEHFKLSQTIEFKISDYNDFQTDEQFDLIVSNPPYFSNALLSDKIDKNQVRHQLSLNLKDFLLKSIKLLSKNGRVAVILPVKEMQYLIEYANEINLYPVRVCNISSFESQEAIRMMVEFVLGNVVSNVEFLHIYENKGVYSRKYQDLTKDFYLAF